MDKHTVSIVDDWTDELAEGYLEIATTRIATGESEERFRQRIDQIIALDHPGIAPIQQAGLMADGRTAVQLQGDAYKPLAGRVGAETAVSILERMSELVETLAYLHELDMVHHDLQTGHLLLTAQNQLKLAGFATFHSQMAGQAAREATTPVGNVYEAPEWRLDHELTSLSNIYSVGAILYELLAGQPPQPLLGEWVVTDSCVVPLLEVCPDLSPQTVELVHTCLADQPNGRYQTMWAVQQAMHQALVAEKKLLKRRHSPNLFDLLALIRQQFGRDTLVACALLIGLGLVALLTSENSELGVVEKIYVFVNTYLGLIPILLLVVLLVIKELLYGFAEDVLIRKIEPMLNHLLVPLMFIGGFIFCLQLVQMIITL